MEILSILITFISCFLAIPLGAAIGSKEPIKATYVEFFSMLSKALALKS